MMYPAHHTGLYPLSATELFINRLRRLDKRAYFAMMYGSDRPTQERIDEEGCGAVVCAARLPGHLYGNQK
jgi:hypothetical protein